MSSSSASDRDMSEGSSSPISYTLRDSPYSSPSQQVPQLISNLTELSCAEKSFHFVNSGNHPQLRIIEQAQNHFRFRYVSEMVGTHGCLLGNSSSSNKPKTHPTVELINYNRRALIRCQLAQCDVEDEHPHKLLEEDQDRDVSSIVPEHNSYKVSFAGMGIIHTAKKDVPNLLFKKLSEKMKGQNYNPKQMRMECENIAKKINLNIVRLKFSAHDPDTGKEICKPVFSEPIHNMKSAATNDLKICRISQYSGRPRGGEDVFILVEKVNKKNIMIRFLELDENGEVVWNDTGSFMQSEVHHQYAIVFRTPPYRDPQTPVDVKVYIELVRPSDGRTSERKEFTYKAEQVYKQFKKRKANSSYSSLDSSSEIFIYLFVLCGSITNEIPTTVFVQSPNDAKDNTEVPLFTIQQLPTGSPGYCGLGSALGTSLNMVLMNTMASPTNTIGSPINMMASSSQTAPMWSGAGIDIDVVTSIPNLKLHSTEMDQITNDVQMTIDDQSALTEADFSQYISSFNSLSDLKTEENPIGEFIRTSAFVSDSGRVKVEPSSPSSSSSQPEKTNSVVKESTEYDAHYKPQDGLEVKKLVQELCQIIKNRKGYKNQEVKSKLERLFEIRLSNGDTFLHMTLCSNQPSFESIVKVINSVNMSHLLNYTNNKEQTILHLAVLHGNAKQIAFLISKGCDPMLRNSEDDNVIQFAVRYNYLALEPMLETIKKNNIPCDLNSCNNEKQTALHLAALSDCLGSTHVLLQYGASYNVCDAAGRTPLHLAAYDAHHNALEILLTHVAENDIDALDGSGNTTLQIVCGRIKANPTSTIEIVKMLLKKKADPLKHEEHTESAWRLARHNAAIRAVMEPYVNSSALEDDVKSEPEDEFESADEDMPETGMAELSLFAREVSERMDANGAWRELAKRVRLDALINWFANQNSPTFTLLYHIKECREDIASKSLAFMLEDMGQVEAANIIKGYLD